MAEKITERKEYRGLGYAPTISVPGLVQTRPVAATRPPQTNELTKLAKSLGDFGETFANSQLRKAARSNEEMSQAGKEAAAQLSRGTAFIPQLPGFEGKFDERYMQNTTARVLQMGDSELQPLLPPSLVPVEATPAFYSALRRNLASVAVSEFNAALLEQVDTAAVQAEKMEMPRNEFFRNIIDTVKADFEESYGKNWAAFAPDKVLEAEEIFLNSVSNQNNKHRKAELVSSTKKVLSEQFEKGQSQEEVQKAVDEQLTQLYEKSGFNTEQVSSLLASAARSSLVVTILRGHPAHASTIVERLKKLKNYDGDQLFDGETVGSFADLIEKAQEDLARQKLRNKAAARDALGSTLAAALSQNKGILSEAQKAEAVDAFLKTEIPTGVFVDGEEVMAKPSQIDPVSFARDAVLGEAAAIVQTSQTKAYYEEGIAREVQNAINNDDFDKAEKLIKENTLLLSGPKQKNLADQLYYGLGVVDIEKEETFQNLYKYKGILKDVSAALEANPDSQEDMNEVLKVTSNIEKELRPAVFKAFEEWLKNPANADDAKSRDARTLKSREIIEQEYQKLKDKYLNKAVAETQGQGFRQSEVDRRAGLATEPKGFPRSLAFNTRVANLPVNRNIIRKKAVNSVVDSNLFKKLPPVPPNFSIELHLKTIANSKTSSSSQKTNAKLLLERYEQINNENEVLRNKASEYFGNLADVILEGGDEDGERHAQLYQTLLIRGIRPDELTSGLIAHNGRTIPISDILKNAQAELNPYTIPFFLSDVERQIIMKTEPETVKKMVKAVGMETTPENIKVFLSAQKTLLNELLR